MQCGNWHAVCCSYEPLRRIVDGAHDCGSRILQVGDDSIEAIFVGPEGFLSRQMGG